MSSMSNDTVLHGGQLVTVRWSLNAQMNACPQSSPSFISANVVSMFISPSPGRVTPECSFESSEGVSLRVSALSREPRQRLPLTASLALVEGVARRCLAEELAVLLDDPRRGPALGLGHRPQPAKLTALGRVLGGCTSIDVLQVDRVDARHLVLRRRHEAAARAFRLRQERVTAFEAYPESSPRGRHPDGPALERVLAVARWQAMREHGTGQVDERRAGLAGRWAEHATNALQIGGRMAEPAAEDAH